MIPGFPDIVCCPSCGGALLRATVLSFNTLGAVLWSDGYEYLPHCPDQAELMKCSHCDSLYCYDRATVIRETYSEEECEGIPFEGSADQEDYLQALESGLTRSIDEEVRFRMRVWWKANDRIRGAAEELHGLRFWLNSDDIVAYTAELIEGYLRERQAYEVKIKAREEAMQKLLEAYPSPGAALEDAYRLHPEAIPFEYDRAAFDAMLRRLVGELSGAKGDRDASSGHEANDAAGEDAEGWSFESDDLQLQGFEDFLVKDCLLKSLLDPNEWPTPIAPELKGLPSEIADYITVHGHRAEDQEKIVRFLKDLSDKKQRQIDELRLKLSEFGYDSDEMVCLEVLAKQLEDRDDLLCAELNRELGRFTAALERVQSIVTPDSIMREQATKIMHLCREQVAHVHVVDKPETIG